MVVVVFNPPTKQDTYYDVLLVPFSFSPFFWHAQSKQEVIQVEPFYIFILSFVILIINSFFFVFIMEDK